MELRVGDGEVAARLDCRADAEPGATVADLRGALAAHAADRGIEVAPDARLWTDDGTALDEATPVVRAGVTSGQRVWLRATPPPTQPSDPTVHHDRPDGSGTVPFNRTPYRPVRVQPRRLPPLPAPPSPPPANRIAITSFVIPLASGVGFAVVFGRPQFLLIALLAPIALGAVTLFERRRGRRSHRAARAEHQALLEERLGDIEQAKEDERAERDRALPPLEVLVEQARVRAPSLWARDRGAPDLLVLRAGRSTLPTLVSLEIERGGDEQLRREAEARIAEAVAEVHDVPVAIDLERAGIVGLHGDPDLVDGLARSLLAQTVVRHGPEDVILVALLAPSALAGYEWLRWLPHVRSAASPLSVPHLAAWPEDVDVLLGALLDVAADRRGSADRDHPRLVVAVHEDAAVDRTALGRLLDDGPGAGIRVLWIGRDEALLPRQCRLLAQVASGDGASVLATTDPDAEPVTFTVEVTGTEVADALARHLAPLRDVTSVAQVGALPRMVGLTDVLADVTPEHVADVWDRSTSRSLAAPVGAGAGGTFLLDLVEQGPHMLIAGTSGAGKSELLQSMVAAMAAQHPPERLTFLFIDYKGGAAAAPFAELPHNVGVVTNLDARLSLRALVSLRAELDRRMAILADAGVADLAQLDPDRAPPRLVIVVDEFATLVKEIPDFVAGVVDVAQRGRSLGIHLVLATQRPAGAVNENILANTNLRVALRVVDAADSQSVIGSPAAAEIPVPLRGRAFARTGPTELVPFQAAWSGAPRHHGGGARVRVAPLGVGRVPDAAAPVALGGTQLDQVLASIGVAHQRRGGAVPRRPWLPPLPDVVDLHDLLGSNGPGEPGVLGDSGGSRLVLGLHDDPEHQARRPAVVELEAEGGLAVFGAGGSGRTTALRTAVASLVAGATPDEVEVVVFDFASRALLPLLELPHTRVVCTADDLDTTAAQIDALAAEVERRRALLGEHRVESLSALRARAGEPVVPRIAVVIDGFGALRAELDTPAGYDWLQRLQRLLVEGRQVGIHPLLSADRRADLPNALLGAIGARLVLRMTEPDALVSLGVPMALARGPVLEPGRGYLRGDEEVQVAVLGPDPSAAAQADAIASLGAGTRRGPRPGPLPEDVARPTGLDHDLVVALGVTDDSEPVTVDLGPGALLIVGPPGSGRTTAAAAVVAGLRAAGHDPVVIDGRDEDAPARLQSLLDAEPPESPVVIDDADELAEGPGGRALEQLATTRGYRLVATADAAAVARAFSGWVPALKRGRRMLLLQPAGAADIDQLAGVRVKLRPGARFPPGRGVLVVDRHARTLQVGRCH
ncbi:FtsK/SpoIIIE domain-containing protein [Acidimicrobiia bacterium EGI L10123]|uniref:FtsK/SpoIIIE domain-containing protein n=1 Tax=Salinilacustrithrix flava TaxID=2957203 RepID=UPI003D7C306F|nr:FtsK/SpoIIIE domain-containing protein [Acidimicrobiia bacterium EGI L10123]